jgi:hypothetical protein
MMRFICRALMCGTMVSELVPEAGVGPIRIEGPGAANLASGWTGRTKV